jgi:hypothetical protein
MKVGQLREVLREWEELLRELGKATDADDVASFAAFLANYGDISVGAVAKKLKRIEIPAESG